MKGLKKMGLYNKQGLYSAYNKNNKERAELDYYATPPAEVTNILNILNYDFTNMSILEPCAGGGHMTKGIIDYCHKKSMSPSAILLSDCKIREGIWQLLGFGQAGDNKAPYDKEYDFLSDDYPFNEADYVIMNPPYSIIEPFVIRGLEIAKKGLLVLGRLQFLESKSRYENLLKENPPSDVYVYVDRIKCYKNGDFTQTESSAQAYAWFYWDKVYGDHPTQLHWIRRV